MSQSDDFEDPRRRLLLQALAAGSLSATLPGNSMAASLFGNVPRKLPPGRSIYRMRGDVLVNGVIAHTYTVIKPSDTVETGNNAEIIFVVGKDAYLMRGSSKLKLEASNQDSGIAATLKLLAGRLLTVFAAGPHSVHANNMVLGVRGTGVYVETNPEETYLCTCYGLVDLAARNDAQSRETIKSEHHDKPRYILANAPQGKALREAPFKNHTDMELAMIEALVGREPPFVFPTDSYSAPRRGY